MHTPLQQLHRYATSSHVWKPKAQHAKNGLRCHRPITTGAPSSLSSISWDFANLYDPGRPSKSADILDIFGDTADGNTTNENLPAGLTIAIKFSDSVVRVCPIDSDDPCGALYYELLSLVHVQMELAHLGVFLRGGVTIGDVYIGGGKIFGPAMVRAYDLESKFAIFPRIVVDPQVIERFFEEPALRGDGHSLDEEIRYLQDLLQSADDEMPFVDYLRAMKTELTEPATYAQRLLDHRTHIIEASRQLATFSNAKQKYFWLAHYHNDVVRALPGQASQAQLQIPLSDLGSFAAE